MISNCACADGSAGGWAGDAGLASRVEHQSKRCALCPRSVIRITQHLKTYLPLIMYALVGILGTPSPSVWTTTYPDGTTLAIHSVALGVVRVLTTPRGAPAMEGAVDLALPQEAAPPPLSVRRTVVGWIVAAGDVAVEVDNSEPIANIVRSADSTPLSLEMSPPALVNGSECGKKRKLHNNEKQIHITSGGVYMYRGRLPCRAGGCRVG